MTPLILCAAFSTAYAEPYNPMSDYKILRPIIDVDEEKIAKYDDGSRMTKKNNQMAINPCSNNPCTIKPKKGYVKNHGGIYKHRARTVSEYTNRVKNAIQTAWHKLTNTDGPPVDTVIALLFDKDGALRYVNIMDTSGTVDDEQIMLEAAWEAGSFPILPKNKDIKPLIISW